MVVKIGDLTVFKMAAVRRLEFLKFKFLPGGEVKRSILHHRTKLCKDRSNGYGDIVIFKMAAPPEILTVYLLYGANVRHRAKFHQNGSNGCRDMTI